MFKDVLLVLAPPPGSPNERAARLNLSYKMQPRNPGMVRWPADMQLYASVLFLALTTQVGSLSSRSQDVPRRVTPWHSFAHTSPMCGSISCRPTSCRRRARNSSRRWNRSGDGLFATMQGNRSCADRMAVPIRRWSDAPSQAQVPRAPVSSRGLGNEEVRDGQTAHSLNGLSPS